MSTSKILFNLKRLFNLSIIIVLGLGGFECVFAQSEDNHVEVFIGGKKYESIRDYKKEQLRMMLEAKTKEESIDPIKQLESDIFINNFLELILERFNEDELKLFIDKLREKRADLFKEDGDNDFVQAQRMLGKYVQDGGKYTDIELDPQTMKTVVILTEPPVEEKKDFDREEASEVVVNDPPAPQDTTHLFPKGFPKKFDIDEVLPFKTIMHKE